MRYLLACLICSTGLAAPAMAQEASKVIAVAISDGPSADKRVLLAFKGATAAAVVREAYQTCYQRAASGYMHTCQVGFGSGWLIAETCALTPNSAVSVIEGDDVSAEAAREKALATLRGLAYVDLANCRQVAEFNANDMLTARSIALESRVGQPLSPSASAPR